MDKGRRLLLEEHHGIGVKATEVQRRVKAQERSGVQKIHKNTIANIPDTEQNFWD